MKVLITGGAGYLGCSLCERLSNNELVEEIVIYDNLSGGNYNVFSNTKIQGRKVRFVHANILNNQALSEAMKGCNVVYHLAGKVVNPDSDADSHYFEQVNNWGTANVVYEAIQAEVERFIFLSTVYVYGQGDEPKTINDLPTPNSFYGVSKLRGEKHLNTLPQQMKHYVIRSGSVYGCNACTRFDILLNRLLFEAHHFDKVTITGEGNQIRPFIHLSKLTDSISQLIESDLPSGTYNIVEHNASVMDMVTELIKLYPNLEYTHVNRHIKMKDIIVEPSAEIDKYIPFKHCVFTEEMSEFSLNLW